MFETHIERLYRVNMNLKESESLLLITDDTKSYLIDLLEEFYEVGRSISKTGKKIIAILPLDSTERSHQKRYG